MQIEVTAQNIDDYGLDELTGNTKETLLRRAAEAAAVGQVLYFKLPDHRVTQNVFDRFKGQPVEPKELEHGVNPIEVWDGRELPEDLPIETHKCVFPPDEEVLEGETFTCPACRRKYYPELSDTRTHILWIPEGEIED